MSTYKYITEGRDLVEVLTWIHKQEYIALDIETGGLSFHKDKISLIQLGNTEHVYVLDALALGDKVRFVLPALQKKVLVGHHFYFDLSMLMARYGFFSERVICTMVQSQILAAGEMRSHKLSNVAKTLLDVDVDKTYQNSDWMVRPLSREQIQYAVDDVTILLPLKDKLEQRLAREGLTKTQEIEMRFLPFLVWMATTGVPLDKGMWRQTLASVNEERAALESQMSDIFPNPQLGLFGGADWPWSAKIKTDRKKGTEPIEKAVLRRLGFQFRINAKGTESINDDDLAAWDHPLAKPLRKWHTCKHNLSTYGEQWLQKLVNDRVYCNWWQMSDTGRTRSSDPNLQNLPRDRRFRTPFVSPSLDMAWIKWDYAGIEMRVAAHVADEQLLKQGWAENPKMDVHMLTATRTLNREAPTITKQERAIAKSQNFLSVYGGGAERLRRYLLTNAGMNLSSAVAKDLVQRYKNTYKGFAAWHRRMGNDKSLEVRTLTGRLRRLPRGEMMTTKCNTVGQGSAADGMKMACGNIYVEREKLKGASPLLYVHDEIDMLCPLDYAEEVRLFVHQHMVDAMQPLIPSIPCVVDSHVQDSWYSEE